MDQAGWHKSISLIIPKNIKIIFLPPYSPELNPVERFWKHIKREVLHIVVYETLDKLAIAIEKYTLLLKMKLLKDYVHFLL
jgi:transposase